MEASDVGEVVGLAVLRGWRCVLGLPSHVHIHALMAASIAAHSRCDGQRFLEHEVLASAVLTTCVPWPEPSRFAALGQPGRVVLGNALAERWTASTSLRHFATGSAVGHALQQHVLVEDIVAAWEAKHGVRREDVLLWPVWKPIALAMAHGMWFGDVSQLFCRDVGIAVPLPVAISPALVRHLMKEEVALVSSPH